MSAAIRFENVDIVFGRRIDQALAMSKAGAGRVEVEAATGAVVGVADANLEVPEGEICVLMGLSGSGKSTLLRAVNGLNRVAHGRVLVRHGAGMIDVAACDAETLRRLRQKDVAMVFQGFALLPWRTVAENVAFGLELAGVPEGERAARVDRQLRLVGLEAWADRSIAELSGGMQQRVGLARAFATQAPILLMDEPFSALDPLIRSKLQDELVELQAAIRKTILFVSHDLEEALKIGDRIAIMDGGRIVQTGSPADIVLKPANAYVRDFVANVNPLSVLTAWNVMQDARDLEPAGEGWVWLDAARSIRFKLDGAGKVEAAERNGRPATWVSCAEADGAAASGNGAGASAGMIDAQTSPVYWARPETSLKTVILAMHRSDIAPVALFDASDRFVGAIGVRKVLEAILRRTD